MVKIRRLIAEDVEAIYQIECNSFSKPWSCDAIEKELENPLAYYVVALEEDKIVGYAGMWQVMGEGQITNVAVDIAHRGHGIGTELMKALIEAGKQNQLEILLLEVRESNSFARGLYKKSGFKEVGLRKNFYEEPVENGILMAYDIV